VTAAPTRPLWRGRALAFTGIVLVAFSLRSAVAALSPILAEVNADLHVPTWVVGLIGARPDLLRGLRHRDADARAQVRAGAARGGIHARRRRRDDRACARGRRCGSAHRHVVLFAAVGVGNVVLPPLIKAYFPDRTGTMTALYSSLLAMAAFVPPLVAVPVADAAGWRVSLGLWAAFAVAAIVPWVTMLVRARRSSPPDDRRDRHRRRATPRVLGRLPRIPLAWALALTFAISAASVYACFAWLPVVLVDIAGLDHAAAGALLSLFGAMGLPWSILVPIADHSLEPRRRSTASRSSRCRGGSRHGPRADRRDSALGRPARHPAGLFPAVLVMIQRRSRTHEGAVALSSFSRASATRRGAVPAGFAVLHEATGDWRGLSSSASLFLFTIPAGIVVTHAHDRRRVGAPSRRVVNTRPAEEVAVGEVVQTRAAVVLVLVVVLVGPLVDVRVVLVVTESFSSARSSRCTCRT
jgi:CP family cyanate transporter-like MFS transporter